MAEMSESFVSCALMRNRSTRKRDREENCENRGSYSIFFLIEFIFHFMQTSPTHQVGRKSFVNCEAKIIFLQTERNKSREREMKKKLLSLLMQTYGRQWKRAVYHI